MNPHGTRGTVSLLSANHVHQIQSVKLQQASHYRDMVREKKKKEYCADVFFLVPKCFQFFLYKEEEEVCVFSFLVI